MEVGIPHGIPAFISLIRTGEPRVILDAAARRIDLKRGVWGRGADTIEKTAVPAARVGGRCSSGIEVKEEKRKAIKVFTVMAWIFLVAGAGFEPTTFGL